MHKHTWAAHEHVCDSSQCATAGEVESNNIQTTDGVADF